MNKENCALKLVNEIILYYDARSKKHQIFELNFALKLIIYLQKIFVCSLKYFLKNSKIKNSHMNFHWLLKLSFVRVLGSLLGHSKDRTFDVSSALTSSHMATC